MAMKGMFGLLMLTLFFTSSCMSLDKPKSQFFQSSKQEVTIVTGLWKLKGIKRDFESFYLSYFKSVLDNEDNMIIFGDQTVKKFTMKYRNRQNTKFIIKNFSQIEEYWFQNQMVSSINQKNKTWFKYDRSFRSVIFAKPQYTSLIYSKLLFMKQAIQLNPFKTDYFVWVDAGIFHTFKPSAIIRNTKRNSISQIMNLNRSPFWFRAVVTADLDGIFQQKYAPFLEDIRVEAGNFGAHKNSYIAAFNFFEIFFKVLIIDGAIFSEESMFRLMAFRYKYLVNFAWERVELASIVNCDFQGRIPLPPVFIRRHNYRVSYPLKNEELSSDFQVFEEEKYDNFPQILTQTERIFFIIEESSYTGCSVALVLMIYLILRRFETLVR